MQTAPPVNPPAPAPSAVPAGSQSASATAAGSKAVEVVQPVTAVQALQPQGRNLQQTLDVLAEHLRKYLRASARDLEFRVDVDAGTTVIVVRDASGAVVRQIPGEEALQLLQRTNVGSGTFLDIFV